MTYPIRKEQTMRALGSCLLAVALAATAVSAEMIKESSITLDGDNIKPFLDRLTQIIDGGFGSGERDAVVKAIEKLEPDAAGLRDFSVKYAGREVPLRLMLIRRPLGAEIRFYTSPELSDRIQKERNVFLDELDR